MKTVEFFALKDPRGILISTVQTAEGLFSFVGVRFSKDPTRKIHQGSRKAFFKSYRIIFYKTKITKKFN